MIRIIKGHDPEEKKVDGKLVIVHEKRIGFAEQQSAYPIDALYPSDTLFPKNG